MAVEERQCPRSREAMVEIPTERKEEAVVHRTETVEEG